MYLYMDNTNVNKCILNIYDVKSEVNVYESYTEFWAEIINACFCSFLHLKDKTDINEFLSNAEVYINYERIFTLFQMTKTLDFMGLEYTDLYSKSLKAKELRHKLYKENTNVLAYYVVKSVLMNNYQLFMKWCRENNTSLLNFNKTQSNQLSFCKFIERHYKNPSLLYGIDRTSIFLFKLKEKKGNQYLKTNMRMSICELG